MRVRIFVQEPSLPGRPAVYRAEYHPAPHELLGRGVHYGWGFTPAAAEKEARFGHSEFITAPWNGDARLASAMHDFIDGSYLRFFYPW